MKGCRHILLAELGEQCEFALFAYRDATAALNKQEPLRFWYSLQALLSIASRVSGLLWPAEGGNRAIAEELRRTLRVSETGHLAPSRLSGTLESADPVLRWAASVRREEVRLANFGRDGFVGGPPDRFLRYFDPDESVFAFCGEVVDCAGLMSDFASLRQRIETEIRRVETVV